ncbi:hypothetical protein AMTR_s00027p00227530 [Amborella trichopoda]|uniref:Uncharacterized protein n=1 Tax=Amborella trichopoda TaxID=13333 RepID=W1PLC0_AMBTC|nr:hypothetical protein AMTR_s00027p00227530 [Amborella trichopoda]
MMPIIRNTVHPHDPTLESKVDALIANRVAMQKMHEYPFIIDHHQWRNQPSTAYHRQWASKTNCCYYDRQKWT